jgi:hypothetical protein
MSSHPHHLNSVADHPSAWRGDELKKREDWQLTFSSEEIAELDAALAAVADRPYDTLSRDDFPLPQLGPRLTQIQHTLEHGGGAARLRGIDVTRYSEEDARRLFFGLSQHIGIPVSQSARGELLFHVRNEGFAESDPRARGPNTAKKLSFHTDRCDVIGFFCWRQAISGGDNELVSSMAICERIRELRPDLLEVLMQPFPYKRHNVDTGNQLPYVMQPVFSFCEGHFACAFLRVLIDRADADANCPTLTGQQREALNLVETCAAELSTEIRQQPGDILFLNNWVTLHRRTAFTDHDEPAERRCLFRIWLSPPNNRPLVRAFADNYGSVHAGTVRGGMKQE